MEKFINYFTPKGKQNLFEKQKTSAFIIIGFFGVLISIIMTVKALIIHSENFVLDIMPTVILALFITVNLFILKKTNIQLVGNIFSTGIVLLIAGAINIINKDIYIL